MTDKAPVIELINAEEIVRAELRRQSAGRCCQLHWQQPRRGTRCAARRDHVGVDQSMTGALSFMQNRQVKKNEKRSR